MLILPGDDKGREKAQRGAGAALWDAARAWIGTPYEHAQRTKGVGVDCVNLILCSACTVGMFRWDEWDVPTQYSPWVNSAQLQAQMARFLTPLAENAELWVGDILLFRIKHTAQHVGLFGRTSGRARVIHASAVDGHVVEHDYERFWQARTVGRYRWRIRGTDG